MTQKQHAISRRTFLGASALGAAALTMSGLTPALADEATQTQESTDPQETLAYTTCMMCNQAPRCGICAHVVDGKVVRVEGNPNHPKSKLCVKGYASVQALYNPNRLLYPVKRTNPVKSLDEDPGWERISWDEALDTIVEELNKAKETYGASSVLFNVGDPKEPVAIYDRLAATFGSPNVSYGRSQCEFALGMSTMMEYGANVVLNVPTDPEQNKVHLCWGSNFAWSFPSGPAGYKLHLEMKRAGVKFIVVDTRMTPTAVQLADIFLQPRTGTDGALALAMANVIINEDLYDHEFIEQWCYGFDEFKEYVAEFTPEKAEEITWVPADKIIEAARLWATEGQGHGTLWCSPHSTTHHTNGIQNQRAINLLMALAGNVDVAGGAKIATSPLDHYDYHAPSGFKKHDVLKELNDQRAGTDRWPVWAAMDPHVQNNGMVEYINEGLIHAGLFVGTNLMVFPQTHLYQEAVASLDFSAAVDMYIKPMTHNFMDIVLPAAFLFERVGPIMTLSDRLFLNERVVEPQGEAREDWDILMDLGCRLGYEDEFFHGDLKAALQAVLDDGNPGVTVEDLEAARPGCYELPPVDEWSEKRYETGALRSDGEPGFNTPTGKVEFVSTILENFGMEGLPVYQEPTVSPISTPDLFEQYPLVLGTGSRVTWYTHSKWRDIPWLNQFMPEPVVFINPVDAEARGLVDGDDVRLFNQLGEVQVKAAVSNIVRPGIVEFHHGWAQANAAELVGLDFDPISGFPAYKDGLCEVEKLA